MTLNGTINPDFGQVEVDPAVVNLSDVETFYPEKRPYFVEGSANYRFGNEGAGDYWGFNWPEPVFFYSRRIGGSGETILGAAKLTGKALDRGEPGLDARGDRRGSRAAHPVGRPDDAQGLRGPPGRAGAQGQRRRPRVRRGRTGRLVQPELLVRRARRLVVPRREEEVGRLGLVGPVHDQRHAGPHLRRPAELAPLLPAARREGGPLRPVADLAHRHRHAPVAQQADGQRDLQRRRGLHVALVRGQRHRLHVARGRDQRPRRRRLQVDRDDEDAQVPGRPRLAVGRATTSTATARWPACGRMATPSSATTTAGTTAWPTTPAR